MVAGTDIVQGSAGKMGSSHSIEHATRGWEGQRADRGNPFSQEGFCVNAVADFGYS